MPYSSNSSRASAIVTVGALGLDEEGRRLSWRGFRRRVLSGRTGNRRSEGWSKSWSVSGVDAQMGFSPQNCVVLPVEG